jgi:hypothetical protein
MPPTSPKPPALSDAELRETIDLLSTVVASMSERLDQQTKSIGWLVQAAELTQKAALMAKKQTDPARFAEELGNKIDAPIWKVIDAFTRLHNTQLSDAKAAKKTAEDLLDAQRDTHDNIHDLALEHIARKKNVWFIVLSALVIGLGVSIALPRFLVGYGWGCAAMGGAWSSASGSDGVCVFYAGK